MKRLILIRLATMLLPMISLTGQTPQAKPPVAVAPVPVSSSTIPQWRIKFFHDQNNSGIDFNELALPGPQTICAFGAFGEAGKRPRGVMVRSGDGGQTWETIKLPDLPVSADFVDGRNGWLVTRDAVHRTLDGGLTWKRSAKLKGVLRVKFLTEQRGFAVGFPKAVWSTADGGATWAPLPAAQLPASRPENSTYSTITFHDGRRGIITGSSRPPRRNASPLPPWMDPATQQRQVPTSLLVLETSDGGQTWTHAVTSAFGQLGRVAFGASGGGLGLMEYTGGSFAYASEVLNLSNSKTAFADKDRAIQDIAYDSGGRAWIAGIAVAGTLNQLPIPSKVVVLQSIDSQHWYSGPVDYRAVANRVRIAFAGETGWLVTDGGMILTLEKK